MRVVAGYELYFPGAEWQQFCFSLTGRRARGTLKSEAEKLEACDAE